MLGSFLFSAILVLMTAFGPALTGGGVIYASAAQVGALVAAWMLVLFGLMSYVLQFARGYLIGVLYAAGLGFGLIRNPWLIVVAGVLVILLGLVVFVRFVRGNPVPGQEGANA